MIKGEVLAVLERIKARSLETSGSATAEAAPLADRDVDGFYRGQLGQRAVTGELLDATLDDVNIARAWRSDTCGCWRRDIVWMVPRVHRYCGSHGKPELPDPDPWPLVGEEKQRAEARAWRTIGPSLGIHGRYLCISFENVERTRAVIVADAYSGNPDVDGTYVNRGVVMEGRPGCGKTTGLICALRRMAVAPGRADYKFYSFPALITALLDPESRDATLHACCAAEQLIVDDIGSSYLKRDGMAAGLIEEIVVHREGEEYPMLASTNLSPKAFRALFGDRVYDRLRGDWGAWINVDAPSRRRKSRP